MEKRRPSADSEKMLELRRKPEKKIFEKKETFLKNFEK
jgi:hypothetical protein